MKNPTVNNIVRSYLEYFEQRGHTVVRSAPLLPEDPTLLFTAAGMVPFKAYYSDPGSAPYPRAASVQKCLRAGGKQSDLENVGRTLRHHTFFEMLGNFSFGDYFKKEAIEWGWDLSVDVWGLDPARIWISVFKSDDEAYDLWHQRIGVPEERIVRLGRKDNFWGPVGDTGVCGPSSEMHYDTGRPGPEGGPGGHDDDDRYIEYWNLVFPQFFYSEAGNYDDLPRPGIDTGLGLERTAFILQGVEDNFHTDEFLPIRNAIAAALPDGEQTPEASLAVNAASDHVRALTFAMAEGIMPSNEGRGYVLRRILRRALTKMHPLGVREPFLAPGVDEVIRVMKVRYPELEARGQLVRDMITAEEERFLDTLELGMERLESLFEASAKKKRKRIPGADVFQLYDTYGFPPELTAELAEERGVDLDTAGFEKAMAEQKERARKSASFDGKIRIIDSSVFTEISDAKTTEFVGYERLECEASVSGVRDMKRPDRDGAFVELTTDRTPFYPEGGGQVGDVGVASFLGEHLEVIDTYRVDDRIAHLVPWKLDALAGDAFAGGADGRLAVDEPTRLATARNHTATHLLHAALRDVLGDHVAQAGSLVAPDRLRFDFHHYQAMNPEEVARVERIVNEAVMADMRVTSQDMPYDAAVAAGAMALFGEKYGDTVRVVSVEDFSKELCGGTHLAYTGEIGPFVVRQESAVGSGLRRVEALTGDGTLDYVQRLQDERHALASMLKVSPDDLERRIRQLVDDAEEMQRELRRTRASQAKDQAGDVLSSAQDVAGIQYVAGTVDAADVPALRQYGDALRGKLDLGVGVLCQNRTEKPVCLVIASDRVIKEKSVTASELAKRIAAELGFRGGGKPHMAQVGLPNMSEFSRLKDFVKASLESML